MKITTSTINIQVHIVLNFSPADFIKLTKNCSMHD